MIHVLKTVQPYFDDVIEGEKTYELRRNDRNFQVNDLLFLCEYNREKGALTGRVSEVRVVHMLREDSTIRGLQPGYVIMGISLIEWGYLEELQDRPDADMFSIKNSRGFRGMVLE